MQLVVSYSRPQSQGRGTRANRQGTRNSIKESDIEDSLITQC